MSLTIEQQQSLLDAALAEPSLRERRQLIRAGLFYATISVLSGWEAFHQSLSRRLVERPEWWFAWVVFGFPSLVSLALAVSRFWVAQSLRAPPGTRYRWGLSILARLPSRETRRNGRDAFAGRDWRRGRDDEVAMTTPEVLRSTSLRSRSAVRGSATPQSSRKGGLSEEITQGRRTPDGRRLFSPEYKYEDTTSSGRLGRLTPLERSKAGRSSLAIRPQDVGGMIKELKEKYAKPLPKTQNGSSSPSPQAPPSLPYAEPYPAPGISAAGRTVGFQESRGAIDGNGPGMVAEARGYYAYGQAGDPAVWGTGAHLLPYQAYEPGEAEMKEPGRKEDREGVEREKEMAKQLLIRLGIADKADDVTTNVKTYVVRLMRKFLEQFDEVCSLLHERGIAEELLCQKLQRQPQLKVKNTPRVLINLSLEDMAVQFGQQAEFWVRGPDGNPVSLFYKYQHLEEALRVTAGSGVPGVGNPAYVLERLRILAEDDFMSAFDYDHGGMYPSSKDWSEELPTDAAVVMRLFVCCSDDLLPPLWEKDRPFARQHLVDRQPCKSDALPGRFFLTKNGDLHPPYFFVVADENIWHALPGPTNVFQAIALFFHAMKTHKSGYLGTGISVASIVREIFGS